MTAGEEFAIDYDAVRAAVPLARVLELLGFQPTTVRGSQLRGRCLLADCSSTSPRCFTANLELNAWYCHACQRGGNQLKLWQLHQQRRLYGSTLALCRAANIPVPRRTRPCRHTPPRSATA
jgi:hypothetical protein